MSESIVKIYSTPNTVFTLGEFAQILGKSNYVDLKAQINYYVRKGQLKLLCRGLYAKQNYSIEEAVCKLYSPAYISLETILQKAGVVFQYYETLFAVSYKSRSLLLDGKNITYRRINPTIACNPLGIISKNGVSEASPERAFLDLVYLDGVRHFDNLKVLDIANIEKIIPIYRQIALKKKIEELMDL